MRKTLLALAASTALTAPAFAQAPGLTRPAEMAESPNVRAMPYNPRARVELVGNLKRATTITFSKAEEVYRVLIGDGGQEDQTWEGPDPEEIKESPLENIVYLYPRRPGYTSITIITKGPKGQRSYQFGALARSVPACGSGPAFCDDKDATYSLTFTYPDDEAEERAAKARQAADEKRQKWEAEAPIRAERAALYRTASMRARLDTDALAGGACRNWKYEAEANEAGRKRIVPDEVTDNGQETLFVFRGNREIPAFYLLGADGKTETPINPIMRGPETLGLAVVAEQIRLRLGEAVVYVYNRNMLPASCVSQTGTNSPDVARVLRRATHRAARPE